MSKNILWFVNIKLTFWFSQNDQRLWALDLSLHYSDSLAMFQLMSYVSNGKLDLSTHTFNVPPPPQVQKKRRRRLAGQDDEPPPNTSRYAVMSTRLLHTNLAVVHYSVFFQMCRAHGIGYDIKVWYIYKSFVTLIFHFEVLLVLSIHVIHFISLGKTRHSIYPLR